MKRQIQRLLSIAALAFTAIGASLVVATPAQAVVVCKGAYSASHKYPLDSTDPTGQADTGHYRFCISNPTAAQIQRSNAAGLSLQGMPENPGINTPLKAKGATFFYFANRADYNSYMAAHGLSAYQTSTARCGNTFYSSTFGNVLISAVFDTCSYANGVTGVNGNPTEALKHESGHAFSVAVALTFGTNGPGRSTGWKKLVNDDLAKMDAIWTAKATSAEKNAYICSIFGLGVLPGVLEIDLGTNTQPVCSSQGVNSYPLNRSPSYIFKAEFPYFFPPAVGGSTPQYEEFWANTQVAVSAPGGFEIMPKLQTAIVKFDSRCSMPAYRYYYANGVAPPQNSNIYVGCGAVAPYPLPADFR